MLFKSFKRINFFTCIYYVDITRANSEEKIRLYVTYINIPKYANNTIMIRSAVSKKIQFFFLVGQV
jgi:hypothetical protein